MTTFTNQTIQFGSLYVSGTAGPLTLAASGTPYDLWTDPGNGIQFLSPTESNQSMAVDWSQNPPVVGTLWDDPSSPQATWYLAPQTYTWPDNTVSQFVPPMFLRGNTNETITMFQPDGNGGVTMGPCLSTFILSGYTPPPSGGGGTGGGSGSTTAATIIPSIPSTGLQGAWWDGNGANVQQFDSDDWLKALNRPPVDASGYQNCVFMDNGVGTTPDGWTQFDGASYYSGQVPLSSTSISRPSAPQYIAIPLQAIPISDPTNPTLNQAGTGAFNAHYTNCADQFATEINAGSKALWRLMWELIAANNTWYAGGYQSGFTPAQATQWAADFVAAWNQMAQMVLAVYPGELIWNLNQDFLACPVWQQAFPTGTYQPSIVGVDVYYQGWMGPVQADGGAGVFNQYHLPGLQAASAFAKANNCRFAICEWGIQNGDAPGWVTALGQFIDSLAGETVTINGQTLPLYTYAGAYIVGPDCIDPNGTPNSMAVYEQPPFAA